jgi:hypothetical protein
MRRSWLGLGFTVLLGCSSRNDRPPIYQTPAGTGGSSYEVADPIIDCGEQTVSDAGLCGNEIIQIQEDRPNLYFILDASGSMGDPISADTTQSKYDASIAAITSVLQSIGHRVAYGAALFPRPAQDTCQTGMQILETQPGDSVACAMAGMAGTVLTTLIRRLRAYSPAGGTPLSETLTSLVPTLTALTGKTAVILATDGAPNCNPNATCTSDLCGTNLSHWQYPNGLVCNAPINCCDPSVVTNGPLDCVDNVATNEVLARLKAVSIPTYVIGLPSANTLSAVLDSMAVAGGTARETSPRYYETDDAQSLADTLRKIATSIAVSCTMKLSQNPPNWAQVAVYFDNALIPALHGDTGEQVDAGTPASGGDGWRQVDASTLQITGVYCDELLTGDVMQVQIVSGCPTYIY